MGINVEVVRPKPVQNEVVIRLPEQNARELMSVLMDELIWHEIEFGETTVAKVYRALELAGIQEA